MKCEPKEIRYRVHQTRYVDVVISAEEGFDMPKTIDEIVSLANSIKGDPLEFTPENAHDWVNDETYATDIEYLD